MRKRKLYLSEFITRCKDKYDSKCQIIVKHDLYTYDQLGVALDDFNGNEEISSWTYNKILGYIIILK